MDKIILEQVITVLAVAVNLILGGVIFLKNRRSATGLFFSLFALSLASAIFSNYFSLHSISIIQALFWIRMVMLSAAPMGIVFYLFVITFPGEKLKINKYWLSFIIILTIISAYLAVTPMLFSGIKMSGQSLSPIPGKGIAIYMFCLIFFMLLGLGLLIKKYYFSSREISSQIRYLLLGFILTISCILFFNVFLVNVFKITMFMNIAGIFSLFYVCFTAYAITKYQLFNIKVILTEIAVGIIGIASLIQAIMAQGTTDKIISWAILIVVIYGSYILIKSVLREILQREEMEQLAAEKQRAFDEADERSRNLITLQKFSNIVLDNIELKQMIQSIIDTIPKEIPGTIGAVVLLVDEEKKNMRGLSISHTPDLEFISKVLKKGVGEIIQPIESQDGLIMQAYHHQEVQRGNHLSDFICPPLEKSVARHIQEESGMHGFLAIPLSAGEEHFGVSLYGLRHPVEKMESDDIGMMIAIAGQVSLAVQRALAYENLKKANEYLEELDRMKDEFISVASHEMNTPLAAIEGYLSMILEEGMGKIDATAKEYLNRVYSSSKRLAALILDLLNVSRIEQGRIHLMYGESKPEDLIKSVTDELIMKAEAKKLYLKFEKPKEALPSTWIDINRIREVLVNLIGNSIKFTEKGGVTIDVKKDGQKLEFVVRDTGVGVLEENVDKLFKKFSQLDRERNEFQGTGLGLFISKRLVELHGGKMWVEATPKGKAGATFKFTIPILKEKPIDSNDGEGAVIHGESVGEKSEVEKEAGTTGGAK